MQALKTFFANNYTSLLAVLLLLVVVYLIYKAGQKKGSNNYTVIDDQGTIVTPSPVQTQLAETVATRIHNDLNSGWLGGYNVLGSIGRDDEAYIQFANMSDTMFAYTAATYGRLFARSIITDIRDESSLPTGGIGSSTTPKDQILAKAQRLNIN